jgi:hypothetical protein
MAKSRGNRCCQLCEGVIEEFRCLRVVCMLLKEKVKWARKRIKFAREAESDGMTKTAWSLPCLLSFCVLFPEHKRRVTVTHRAVTTQHQHARAAWACVTAYPCKPSMHWSHSHHHRTLDPIPVPTPVFCPSPLLGNHEDIEHNYRARLFKHCGASESKHTKLSRGGRQPWPPCPKQARG